MPRGARLPSGRTPGRIHRRSEWKTGSMSQAIRTICFALSVVIFALSAAPQSTGRLESAASGLQRRYAGIRTILANFRQTYRAPGIEMVESGVLWMKKPGLMRWEYRDPEIKLFVADGREMYLYTPEDRQVLVSRLGESDLRSTPLQFLLGRGDLEKSFRVSTEERLKSTVPGSVMLRLVPRSSERDYDFVVLELDGKTYDLCRMVIGEKSGNTSEFLFTDIKTNIKIDDRQFQFKIPKGVEVVRLEEKD
jgi:outer membrane lipoprotein carrier protein